MILTPEHRIAILAQAVEATAWSKEEPDPDKVISLYHKMRDAILEK